MSETRVVEAALKWAENYRYDPSAPVEDDELYNAVQDLKWMATTRRLRTR